MSLLTDVYQLSQSPTTRVLVRLWRNGHPPALQAEMPKRTAREGDVPSSRNHLCEFLLEPAILLVWILLQSCNGKNMDWGLHKICHQGIICSSKRLEIPTCPRIWDSWDKQKHVHTVEYYKMFLTNDKDLCLLNGIFFWILLCEKAKYRKKCAVFYLLCEKERI